MEGFVTAITDEWTFLKKHRSTFLGLSCLVSFGIGILFVTEVYKKYLIKKNIVKL